MICATMEKTEEKTWENIYNPTAYINKPIESYNGLSIRRMANILHNSLMLVENPEDVNYNAASRLYSMFTKDLNSRQKIELNWLLRVNYASEDEELAKRLEKLSEFGAREGIETREDLAADIMASIMYTASGAGKQESRLAGKYVEMLPELEEKGINLDNVLHSEINNMGAEMFGYKKHVTDFMDSYMEQKKDPIKVKVIARGSNGEKKVTEFAGDVEDYINSHTHKKAVVGGEVSGNLYDIGEGGIEGLLGSISALNPAD